MTTILATEIPQWSWLVLPHEEALAEPEAACDHKSEYVTTDHCGGWYYECRKCGRRRQSDEARDWR